MLAPAPEATPGVPDRPEGRRTRRRRELHQAILATAASLFARDGFDATTVERIAEAADIAPATFFNHFRSKEDVLREAGRDVFSRFHRLVAEQLERDATTAERLAGFAARAAELVERAPEMTRRVLIAVLRSSRPGESGAELASMQADFAELLRRGRDDAAGGADATGADRARGSGPASPPDVELAAEILVSVVIGAMTHWINDPTYPLDERLRDSLALLADRLLEPANSASPTNPARTRAPQNRRATTARDARGNKQP